MTDPSPSEINGRFKVLPGPANLPGKCGVCGAVNRQVLDFGLDIRGYGTLYLCTDCCTEAASRIGMVHESRLRDNQRETDQIVWDYLTEHKLRAITDEQFGKLADAGAVLRIFDDYGAARLLMEIPAEATQESVGIASQLSFLDFDDDGEPLVTDFPDGDDSGSGGPSSVSTDALSRLE
jgi:hypothetical protein